MKDVDLDRLRKRLWLHAAAVAAVWAIGGWFVADGKRSGLGMIAIALLTLVPVHLAAWSARRRSKVP